MQPNPYEPSHSPAAPTESQPLWLCASRWAAATQIGLFFVTHVLYALGSAFSPALQFVHSLFLVAEVISVVAYHYTPRSCRGFATLVVILGIVEGIILWSGSTRELVVQIVEAVRGVI